MNIGRKTNRRRRSRQCHRSGPRVYQNRDAGWNHLLYGGFWSWGNRIRMPASNFFSCEFYVAKTAPLVRPGAVDPQLCDLSVFRPANCAAAYAESWRGPTVRLAGNQCDVGDIRVYWNALLCIYRESRLQGFVRCGAADELIGPRLWICGKAKCDDPIFGHEILLWLNG